MEGPFWDLQKDSRGQAEEAEAGLEMKVVPGA